jgi:hypothetical protein
MTRPLAQETVKFGTLLALETVALVAWFSGVSGLVTWWFYGTCLELFGPGPVAWFTNSDQELSYGVMGRGYHIEYWCTPTSIWTGGFLLLWAGAPTWRSLLKRSILYAASTFVALAANFVLSVWLHPHVPGWYSGHIPGTVIIYVTAFIVGLVWIFRAPAAAGPGRRRDGVLAPGVPAPSR